MRVIYRKIRRARYLYIKRNVEKVWGARYLSKNTVYRINTQWDDFIQKVGIQLFGSMGLLHT